MPNIRRSSSITLLKSVDIFFLAICQIVKNAEKKSLKKAQVDI